MTQVLGAVAPAISDPAQIGVREFKCDYCGKNYSSANSLKTHIKWHTGDLKHKCSFCEKKFRNHSELRRHEMVHTGNIFKLLLFVQLPQNSLLFCFCVPGERPNQCSFCNKKFIQKHALKDHMRKRHAEMVNQAGVIIYQRFYLNRGVYLAQSYLKIRLG